LSGNWVEDEWFRIRVGEVEHVVEGADEVVEGAVAESADHIGGDRLPKRR